MITIGNAPAAAPGAAAPSELKRALRACRSAFVGVALMSGMLNVLYLTGSFFMLEVYDRVLPSRSVPTLIGLALIAATLYAFQAVIDIIRGRVLTRIGMSLDESLTGRIYAIVARLPLHAAGESGQPVRDLDQLRAFLSGQGPSALFDLPWLPLYVAICFVFHPFIGMMATAGAAILVSVTLATEFLTRAPVKDASVLSARRTAFADATRRNAEVVQAMGMLGSFGSMWAQHNAELMQAQRRTSDIAGGLGATSKVLRMALQSAVLGLGAWLVIRGEATAGIIIASSILAARALAPVELAIAHWRGFVAARQSFHRLGSLLRALPQARAPLDLPRPARELAVEAVTVAPPGGRRAVVQDVSFRLEAGAGLGIIGPSASGKSSLVRALVGAWMTARGKIRLDGAALEQWSSERLGRHVGYLPQDVELFAGTVAQNIARFDENALPEAVIAAARAAGVHEMVLRLPDGYETQIGEGGAALSAGQRQRIGLARALYGEPFLVVLDEPNSNLDADGDAALNQAILEVRARGGIVVLVAHRPSALAGVDQVLVMADGRASAFGPKDEVLKKVLQRPQVVAPVPSRPQQLRQGGAA